MYCVPYCTALRDTTMYFAVGREVRRHDVKTGAHADRAAHRHGRSDSVPPRLVARGGDDTARLGGATDRYGPAAQIGTVTLFDRRVEGVHVDMENASEHESFLGAEGGPPETGTGPSLAAPSHRVRQGALLTLRVSQWAGIPRSTG